MVKLYDLLMEAFDLNPNVEDIKYVKRYNNDAIIKLNIDKVLKQHDIDSPEYSILNRSSKNVISQNRIDSAKEYWQKYSKNQRWLRPDGTRSMLEDMMFEPSLISFENGKLGFTDGRHRLIAMKELGYKYAMFEVPKNQLDLFKKLK